jgi:hypothetical protein
MEKMKIKIITPAASYKYPEYTLPLHAPTETSGSAE